LRSLFAVLHWRARRFLRLSRIVAWHLSFYRLHARAANGGWRRKQAASGVSGGKMA
jgi:hypothetical protein